MPKKTKRQKILAEQRRHATFISVSDTPSAKLPEPTIPSPTFRFQQPHVPEKTFKNLNNPEELIVIKKDLSKTLILAIIAVIIEIGVNRLLRGT